MPRRSRSAAIRTCRSRCSVSSSRARWRGSCWAMTRARWCTSSGAQGTQATRTLPAAAGDRVEVVNEQKRGRELMIEDIKKSTDQRMNKTVEALKADLGKVRTGRAHTGLLDHLHVDYYGTSMPINQVANVTLADARTIAVQPWEKKMVQAVEKAIRDSDLGLNPATQGEIIRIPMP